MIKPDKDVKVITLIKESKQKVLVNSKMADINTITINIQINKKTCLKAKKTKVLTNTN